MATSNLERKPPRVRGPVEDGFDAAAFVAAYRAAGNRVTIEQGRRGQPVVSIGAVTGLNPISVRLERKFGRQRRADPDYLQKIIGVLRQEGFANG